MTRVAAIQMTSCADVARNLASANVLLREARTKGARIAALPENFAYMGLSEADKIAIAEPPGDGPIQSFLAATAAELGLWIVAGTVPIRLPEEPRVAAACLVFDDRGRAVARYDKIHLFDVSLPGVDERYQESATIEPGESVVVTDSPFGRLGVAVCYDLRFPELFRQMLDEGVELLAIPSAFTAITGKAHWETLVRARAIENLAYVVAAAQGGFHLNGRETHGHSMVVDPWGTVLAQVPRGTGFICCPLDREFQGSVRRNFPAIDHRRLKCSV
jgi:nitrilase